MSNTSETKATCTKHVCCCKCLHQLELRKHPGNTIFGKGSILEKCGYVCTAPEIGEGKSAIYFDTQHGECENFLKQFACMAKNGDCETQCDLCSTVQEKLINERLNKLAK